MYYFGRGSSELAQLVPPPYSHGKSTHYSDRLHVFFATIMKMLIPTVYFLEHLGSRIFCQYNAFL